MKHLVSLSLKYLRRQKLRTLLTFLCIVLSVFLLNAITAFVSSFQVTMQKQEILLDGSWEADVTELLNRSPKDNAYDIVTHHAVVDDWFYESSRFASGSYRSESPEASQPIGYIDLTLDNHAEKRLFLANFRTYEGTPEVGLGKLLHPEELKVTSQISEPLAPGHALVPTWFQDYGYQTGDTVHIRMQYQNAVLSKDAPERQAVRELIDQLESQTEYRYLIEGEEMPDEDESKRIKSNPLMSYLVSLYDVDAIGFTETAVGEPVELTLTIDGFIGDVTMKERFMSSMGSWVVMPDMTILTARETLPDLHGMDLSSEGNDADSERMLVRVKGGMKIEEMLEPLYLDLGLDPAEMEETLNTDINRQMYNGSLLMWEVRGAHSVAALLQILAVFCILAILLWFVARFVIDNAFEISVQERSRQFAILRIMGASQMQLKILIFTEAIIYCLTAIPLGAGLAYLFCYAVMHRFHDLGFEMMTFYVNPKVFAFGILCSILAIGISAYTSAIWAARKLSPLEALQFGKPRKKAAKVRHRAHRLTRSNHSFILRYTLKNMMRTKSRFWVASIAMMLGVMLFTLSTLISGVLQKTVSAEFESYPTDYYISTQSLDTDLILRAERELNDPSISHVDLDTGCDFVANTGSIHFLYELVPGYREYMSEDNFYGYFCYSILMTNKMYDETLRDVTGISYEAWKSTGKALLFYPQEGLPEQQTEDEYGKPVKIFEPKYESMSSLGLDNAKIISVQGEEVGLLGRVTGALHTNGYTGPTLLVPVESADTMLPRGTMGTLQISVTINGAENRDAADAVVHRFHDSLTEFSYFTDQYLSGTGMTEFYKSIMRIIRIVLLVIWAVGVFSMVNTVNTSVLNRQNELVMMRAVGMTRRQLSGTVLLESALFCGISTVCGLIVSIICYFCGVAFMLRPENGDVDAYLRDALVQPGLIVLVIAAVLLINLVISVFAAIPGIRILQTKLKQT